MANKPGEADFFPEVPEFPSMGTFQPVYGKFDLTTYIQGASDYEIMAFLVGKYNACLEAYGDITKLSTDTITACKQLQSWINSWFDNLNVQEELNKKLDSMVQDGSFETLLHQTFDTQINQQTTSAVTAWLVDNVTPTGSAVIVDKSLSIEGAAADAKATGERIGLIATINRNYFNQNDALSGYFYDGKIGETITTYTNAVYACVIFPVIKGKTYVVSRTDYRWFELDNDNKILSQNGNSDTKTQLSVTPNTAGVKKVAISWQKNYVPIANYMILDSGVSFNTYIPYPYTIKLTDSVVMNSELITKKNIDLNKTKDVLNEFSVLYNYFNPADALSEFFYDGDVGDTIKTHPNKYYACVIFPVIKGKTYVVARTDYRWNELDGDNKILSIHGNTETKTQLAITPNTAGVKKVAISWQKNYVPIANYMILDSGVSFNTYVPYPKTVRMSSDLLNNAGVEAEATYTVGTNGDFDSFSGMLVALKGNTSKKTVYIETGIYDIFTEMGGQAYIESIDVDKGWLLANNIVPPNTKIIGVGDVVLRYKPTDSEIVDYKHGWLMSPLNIVDSCEIENISVEASNCRYAIHIESSSGGFDPNKANIKLKNVRAHRSVTTMMGDHQTVGTGIGFNAKWEFEECRFTSDGTAPVFSVHTNAPPTNSKASVLMKNCVFVTTHDNTHKLVNFISAYLPVAVTNIAIVANCFVGGKIGSETNITNRQSFDVSVIGGASYGIENSATQTSGYTINNYGHNTLS